MATRLTRLFLLLFALSQVAATCNGTETGNPSNNSAGGGSQGGEASPTESYQNTDFGVTAEYDTTWSVTENVAPASRTENATPTDEGSADDGAQTPAAAPPTATGGGIDTSDAPSTVFTDGQTIVTLYYVTLETEPESLEAYLSDLFPTRTFVNFVNPHLSGLTYDDPSAGDNGGDRQEYYFLRQTTLLYVVADISTANQGLELFTAFIQSLRFE